MSNDEYMKLYEQFKPMIIKLVHKWSKLNIIEFDELMQISLLALIEAYNSYDETRGKKFSSYVYDMIEYKIRKEIYITDRKNKRYKTVSLNSTAESGEGDTIELIDLIADNLDLEEEVQNEIMVDYYESECKRVLPKDKFEICYLRWFESYSYKAIEKVTKKNNISSILLQSQSLLLAKSRLFNEEYKKLVGISDYNTQRMALI